MDSRWCVKAEKSHSPRQCLASRDVVRRLASICCSLVATSQTKSISLARHDAIHPLHPFTRSCLATSRTCPRHTRRLACTRSPADGPAVNAASGANQRPTAPPSTPPYATQWFHRRGGLDMSLIPSSCLGKSDCFCESVREERGWLAWTSTDRDQQAPHPRQTRQSRRPAAEQAGGRGKGARYSPPLVSGTARSTPRAPSAPRAGVIPHEAVGTGCGEGGTHLPPTPIRPPPLTPGRGTS